MLKLHIHDTYLSHYGVKGMKWGVRKQVNKPNRTRAVSEMSNRELQEYINRKSLEQQYMRLSASRSFINRFGSKFVSRLEDQIVNAGAKFALDSLKKIGKRYI